MEQKDGDFEFYIRSLSSYARDSSSASDPSSDPYLLPSVKKIYEMCKEGESDELVTRAFNQMSKLFQRCISTSPQSQSSNGVLLLTILQFFMDFGDVVLHDTDPSLRSFFRSCLSREFADPIVAEQTLEFLISNQKKISSSFPSLLPQFFPLLLKLIAWNGERLEKQFLTILPTIISPGSFLPLFSSLIDLPLLVVALEKVEKKSSGTLIGTSIASIKKSAAPEMLLALMDEAYTGSTIEDRDNGSGLDDNGSLDFSDPSFLEILKDENDGIAERHWTSPVATATMKSAVNSQSERLSRVIKFTPNLLSSYFSVAIRDINDSLLCALIPLLMTRYDAMCPDKVFCFEVRKRLSDFMLAVFQRSPNFIALLKKPIMDRLSEAYDSPTKTELALHLCWAIGEHGAGGTSHNDIARVLFESLELLLYENLSSSRNASEKSSLARLLCFVVTAIAKLATCHSDLLPRARVSLAKVARSKIVDRRVWRRACDYLGLMEEPAICTSVLGPTNFVEANGPGVVDWSKGDTEMISHVPFYILGQQQGMPYHDFSFADVFPVE